MLAKFFWGQLSASSLPALPVSGATSRWNANDFKLQAEGTTVSSWTDSIGAKTLTTIVGTPKVHFLSGKPSVQGDKASNAYMKVNLGTGTSWSVAIVMNSHNGHAVSRMWNLHTTDSYTDLALGVSAIGANNWYVAGAHGDLGATIQDNTKGVLVLTSNSTTPAIKLYWNDVLFGTATNAHAEDFLFLFNSTAVGDGTTAFIYEMAFYDGTVLTAANVTSWQNYAVTNWGF